MSKCTHGSESVSGAGACADCWIDHLADARKGRYLAAIDYVYGIENVAFHKGWSLGELTIVMPLHEVQLVLRNGKDARAAIFDGRRGVILPGAHADMQIAAAPRDAVDGAITVERHGDVILRIAP